MPADGEELVRFLGLANYFSDFIDHFAETAKPLYDILRGTNFSKKKKRGERFVIKNWDEKWGHDQKEAWNELRDAL